MYYKITNTECEVYKKLHEMRTEEAAMNAENKRMVRAKVVLDFDRFYGSNNQQNWDRVQKYEGFCFKEHDKVDLKIWKKHKEDDNTYVPNLRTEVGREMSKFLKRILQKSDFRKPFKILGIDYGRRFTFPFVEIVGGTILLYLSDHHQPKDENVIEITSREFFNLTNKQ